MNIYDFRDFRKKWLLLQEKLEKRELANSKIETNNKDAIEIDNESFTEDDAVDWAMPMSPDRSKILNTILDEMIEAFEKSEKFSDGIKVMDEILKEEGITLAPDEENKLFKAYKMVTSGTHSKEELPPPFGTGIEEETISEARKRKIKEKKKKIQKNSKFKEDDELDQLDDLVLNSKFKEDDSFKQLDNLILNSMYEEDDELDQLDDLVLNSKYKEDDDSDQFDELDLNSKYTKKIKRETVTSADVGSSVDKAPDAKLKKETKRKVKETKKKIKEAEEFDDPKNKELEDVETDVDAELSNQETDSENTLSINDLLDQLKDKFQEKFPGKEILITVKSSDEPIDDEIVSKAKEAMGSESDEEESNTEEFENENTDTEQDSEDEDKNLEGKVFSKGKIENLETDTDNVQKESYKKTIRALRKIIKEAKEELQDIEKDVSQEKTKELGDKDIELNDTNEKETDELENTEENDSENNENVSQNKITLSIDKWKNILD